MSANRGGPFLEVEARTRTRKGVKKMRKKQKTEKLSSTSTKGAFLFRPAAFRYPTPSITPWRSLSDKVKKACVCF